jgi:hypothetical protein
MQCFANGCREKYQSKIIKAESELQQLQLKRRKME